MATTEHSMVGRARSAGVASAVALAVLAPGAGAQVPPPADTVVMEFIHAPDNASLEEYAGAFTGTVVPVEVGGVGSFSFDVPSTSVVAEKEAAFPDTAGSGYAAGSSFVFTADTAGALLESTVRTALVAPPNSAAFNRVAGRVSATFRNPTDETVPFGLRSVVQFAADGFLPSESSSLQLTVITKARPAGGAFDDTDPDETYRAVLGGEAALVQGSLFAEPAFSLGVEGDWTWTASGQATRAFPDLGPGETVEIEWWVDAFIGLVNAGSVDGGATGTFDASQTLLFSLAPTDERVVVDEAGVPEPRLAALGLAVVAAAAGLRRRRC